MGMSAMNESFGVGVRGSSRLSWTVLALLVLPVPASAHLMNTGFGPFYDGLTHFFATPEDLLPAVALALLGGLRGPRAGRAVLFVLPLAWLMGSVAGLVAVSQPKLATTTATATIALGALVAADMPLPVAAVASLALVLGLLHGGLNGVELANARTSALCIAGVVCALFVLVSLLAGQIVSLRAPWARVVVRVAGSWITAIGLLMLGWSLAQGLPMKVG
jgi:urease accessory protein